MMSEEKNKTQQITPKLFIKRLFGIIRFPQYSLLVLELLFLITCLIVATLEMSYKIIPLEFYIICLITYIFFVILSILKWFRCKTIDLIDFRSQLTSNVLKTKDKTVLKVFCFTVRSFILLLFTFLLSYLSIDNKNYTFLLNFLYITLILEIPWLFWRKSPFAFYFVIGLPLILISSIGIDKGILKWGFLSIILVTIGASLFDSDYLQKKININISREELIDKKVNYLLMIPMLYLALLLSEVIVNSYAVKLLVSNSKIDKLGIVVIDIYCKLIIGIIIFALYKVFADLLLYWGSKILFVSYKNNIDGKYREVWYDRITKKWKLFVGVFEFRKKNEGLEVRYEGDVGTIYSFQDINQKTSDVIQIKNENNSLKYHGSRFRYFVREQSKIIDEIDGSFQDFGDRLLGNFLKGGWPIYLVILILAVPLLALSYFIEDFYKVDGSYVNVSFYKDNDKINYIFDWNKVITIKNKKFYYEGYLSKIDSDNLDFDNNSFYGNMRDNQLHIYYPKSNEEDLFVKIDSQIFKRYLKRTMDNASTTNWVVNMDESLKHKMIILSKEHQ